MGALLAQSIAAWRSGFRGRGARLIFLLGLLTAVTAWLAAEFSGRQPETVALDVGISLIRLFGALLVLFWVTELLGKDLERRTIYFVLAYPIPRGIYILSRFLAVAALAAFTVIGLGLFALLAWWIIAHSGYDQSNPVYLNSVNILLTLGLIWLDLMAIAAFTLLIAAISTTPMLAFFVGLAFVVAARSLGSILAFLTSGQAKVELVHTYQPLINGIQWLIPDLSRLDIRTIVLYGTRPETATTFWPSIQVALYCVIALVLAMLFFKQREFN